MNLKLKPKQKKPSRVSVAGFLGLPEFPRPAFAEDLVFPNDLTALTSENVSDLLGKYTAMYSYVSQERARYTIEELILHKDENALEGELHRTHSGLRNTEKWRRDTIMAGDPEMVRLRERIAFVQAAKKAADVYCDNYERYVNALSRELSRKSSSIEARVPFNSSRNIG